MANKQDNAPYHYAGNLYVSPSKAEAFSSGTQKLYHTFTLESATEVENVTIYFMKYFLISHNAYAPQKLVKIQTRPRIAYVRYR